MIGGESGDGLGRTLGTFGTAQWLSKALEVPPYQSDLASLDRRLPDACLGFCWGVWFQVNPNVSFGAMADVQLDKNSQASSHAVTGIT